MSRPAVALSEFSRSRRLTDSEKQLIHALLQDPESIEAIWSRFWKPDFCGKPGAGR